MELLLALISETEEARGGKPLPIHSQLMITVGW